MSINQLIKPDTICIISFFLDLLIFPFCTNMTLVEEARTTPRLILRLAILTYPITGRRSAIPAAIILPVTTVKERVSCGAVSIWARRNVLTYFN